MRQKTLQEEYNLIKEGKGSKEIFLKKAKSSHPHLIRNASTFNEAEMILKQRSVISENIWGVATEKNEQHDWFNIFKENIQEAKSLEDIIKSTKIEGSIADLEKAVMAKAKEEGLNVTDKEIEDAVEKHADMATGLFEAKAVEKKVSKEVTDLEEKNFDYKDKKNVDNVYGEAFLKGYYTEMKDPKNADKTVDELKEMVAKNLAKDQLYYVKDGQFGVKGVGYTDELPGLKASKTDQMEKVKMNENKNKMIKLSDLLEEGYGAREYEMGKQAGEKAEKKKVKKMKKESVQDRIKEIEKKGSIAALEAKMNALDEEIEMRENKLNMVSENEDLAEFVNPARINEMKKEIKELNKAKVKYGKMYERLAGQAYTKPVVTEEDGE